MGRPLLTKECGFSTVQQLAFGGTAYDTRYQAVEVPLKAEAGTPAAKSSTEVKLLPRDAGLSGGSASSFCHDFTSWTSTP